MKKGFTLIELLVVVLVIGLLAAVAIPQYQKTVEKSKSAQAVIVLKAIYQAAIEFQLANGTWPTSFADLTAPPPWTGTTTWYTSSLTADVLSNKEWSMQITASPPSFTGVNIGRLSGPYKGGGFVIWYQYTQGGMPLNTLLCAEKKEDITTAGSFCQKVMQSGKLVYNGSVLRLYQFL